MLDLDDREACAWLVLQTLRSDAEFRRVVEVARHAHGAVELAALCAQLNAYTAEATLTYRFMDDELLHRVVVSSPHEPYLALGILLSGPFGVHAVQCCGFCEGYFLRTSRHGQRHCRDSCRARSSQRRLVHEAVSA